MILTLLALIVCLFVGIAHERASLLNNDEPLQKCILVCMALITVFGGVMVNVGDYKTNAGAVLYAGVLGMQYLIMRKFGWQAGTRCVISTFIGLVMLTAIMAVLAELAGGDPLGSAYALVIETSRQLAVASFIAFAFGQTLFVLLFRASEHLPLAISYGVNVTVVQALDSMIFFPVAFGFDNLLSGPMLPGYLIKVALGLLAAPLLALAIRPRL